MLLELNTAYCLWLLVIYNRDLSSCSRDHLWPRRTKILTAWPFTEKVFELLPQRSPLPDIGQTKVAWSHHTNSPNLSFNDPETGYQLPPVWSGQLSKWIHAWEWNWKFPNTHISLPKLIFQPRLTSMFHLPYFLDPMKSRVPHLPGKIILKWK